MTNKPPATLSETMERVYKEMDVEETMDQRMKEELEWQAPRLPRNQNRNNRVMTDLPRTSTATPIIDQKEIFRDLKNKGIITPTRSSDTRNLPYKTNDKYCEYHQNQSHSTEECRTLASRIEKYQSQEKLPGPPKDKQNVKGTVFMILDGDEANTIQDTKEVTFPHLDPLVISPIINEFLVQRVLVDTGASVDVIYWGAFKNLKLEEKDLSPNKTQIKGFGQMKIPVVGTITLPVTLGREE